MQLESPKDILDFMRFSLHISNTTPTVWDDTWLNFVSFSPHSKLSELCLFFQFYRWKADSEKLNVSLSGRGRTHASPTWQLLNGFSILPSWKVTTEIDWQKSMLQRLGLQPCNYQRWGKLGRNTQHWISSNESSLLLKQQHVPTFKSFLFLFFPHFVATLAACGCSWAKDWTPTREATLASEVTALDA